MKKVLATIAAISMVGALTLGSSAATSKKLKAVVDYEKDLVTFHVVGGGNTGELDFAVEYSNSDKGNIGDPAGGAKMPGTNACAGVYNDGTGKVYWAGAFEGTLDDNFAVFKQELYGAKPGKADIKGIEGTEVVEVEIVGAVEESTTTTAATTEATTAATGDNTGDTTTTGAVASGDTTTTATGGNTNTGVALAIIPTIVAAGAAVVASKKRK